MDEKNRSDGKELLIQSGSDYSRVYEEAGQKSADPGAMRRHTRVIYFNIFFMVIEILGGSLARSFAVISEGSMLVIDTITNLIRICGAYSMDRKENMNFTFGYRRVEPIGIVLEISLVWFCMILLLIFAYYMHMITDDDKPLRPFIMLFTSIITLIGDFTRVVVVYGCPVLPHLFKYPFLSKAERENTKIRKGTKDISIRRIMEHIKGKGN